MPKLPPFGQWPPKVLSSPALQLVVVLAFLHGSALGQVPAANVELLQTQDPEFARLVKEWTTKPEFLSPLVDHLPIVEGIPSPKDYLGYYIGMPQKLTYYDQIVGYFKELAAATPRIELMNIGKTDEGRDYIVVAIGAEDSIQNLELIRTQLAKLADPREISEAQAREIIARTKPIYHLMGGLHSGETGPPEMLMELGYRLAVEESPLIEQIRNNIVVTIAPVAEPDGRDRYVDWYYRHLIDIDKEEDRVSGPPYWGKYIFHDNNRDINYSQITMRLLLDWYLQWHPPIVHDLHESVPYLYTFSGQAPQNPALDPILYGELPWFANFEMAQLIKYGMPGVWTHAFVDMWSPGYLGFMSSNHNGMLRMYETFGNGGATTMVRKLDSNEESRGRRTSREWYRPLPPYKEVEWSIRNNTNYMQTGVLSALQLTSEFPKVVLENFYRKSRNSIESGKKTPPHGYIIPSEQRDMTRVGMLVNLLRIQGIEVGVTKSEIEVEEEAFPVGSYVIKLDQPYGRLAKILLGKQKFPDPSLRTYDDTGWTMGLMFHCEVKAIEDKSVLELPVEMVNRVNPAGWISGGPATAFYAIPHYGSNNMMTLRYRLNSLMVVAAEDKFEAEEMEFPAGTFLIPAHWAGENVQSKVASAVEDLGLFSFALDTKPDVPTHNVDIPRLAVFSTWGGTQSVGWVCYALDKFEVKYDLIFKERIKEGNLSSSYDVILIPHQGGSGKRIVFGIESKGKPLAYTQTDQFKYLGFYGKSPDITGGMGLEGVLEFHKFIDDGGVLITLGSATYFPTEFGLTRRIDANRTSSQFYAPGPIVQAKILQTLHPIFYGYVGDTTSVRYAGGPLLRVPDDIKEKQILMRFSGGEDAVLSGLMRSPNEIKDRPAILDVPVGKGRVLLFATNPCYRWQNHAEFNMMFNSILHFNDVVNAKKEAEEKTGRNIEW